MARIIIIGRNFTSRLGMIRAIGEDNSENEIVVIKTNGDKPDIDAYSKYISSYVYAREPNRSLLIETIQRFQLPEEKSIIIPVDDYSASVVDEYADVLKKDFMFPHIEMSAGAINQLMDKSYQKAIATTVGLKVANGVVIHLEDGLFQIPDTISFPCFPKPLVSYTGNKTCMRCCRNRDELESTLASFSQKFPNCSILVEEYIKIDKEYATLGFSDGERVIIPGMIQILQDGRGHHKGVTLLGRVLPEEGFVSFLNDLKKLILETHFVGLFDIDSYDSGGVMHFNELNLRFGASGYAFTGCGVNLPAKMIRYFLGIPYNMEDSINKATLFLNEKVAYEDTIEGYLSPFKYKRLLKNKDLHFIKNQLDSNPFDMFIAGQKHFLKPLAKYTLRCLKLR